MNSLPDLPVWQLPIHRVPPSPSCRLYSGCCCHLSLYSWFLQG